MTIGTVSAEKSVETRGVNANSTQIEIPGEERFRKACRDFEAIFIRHLLKTMRSSGRWDGFLKGNRGEEIFRDRLDAALADSMSQRETLGIARTLYQQLSKEFPKADKQHTQVICDA
ncbi:MAG: rod-binding protein [Armatimonadota bacterium]